MARIMFMLGLALGPYGVSMAQVIPIPVQDGWEWSRENTMDVSGMAISERHWQAPVPLAQAARQLSEHFTVFDRMLILDERIVLSGLDGDRHWLAELSRTRSGSYGMISVAYAGLPIPAAFDFSPYLPGGADPVFSNVDTLNNIPISRAAYRSKLDEPGLHRYLARALCRSGWRRVMDPGGFRQWRRGGARLDLKVLAQSAGTVLWLQHVQEPGNP